MMSVDFIMKSYTRETVVFVIMSLYFLLHSIFLFHVQSISPASNIKVHKSIVKLSKIRLVRKKLKNNNNNIIKKDSNPLPHKRRNHP